ncbi:hypothetical protein [Deinococcus roseus]|uniref:Transposase n=1 Tax=Deinococcus roseus TaxID=392414 RepID=A0ABQ2DH96_9DEIO|nr:hypothetical protein [Deinococcus roseus]GGJ55572.1 hypothetical protein GCM10008938_47200 [Deinococcus roseus]
MNNTPPLRTVLGTTTLNSLPREVLACGHLVRIKQDHYGPTNAKRRRCKKCQTRQAIDWTPEQIASWKTDQGEKA